MSRRVALVSSERGLRVDPDLPLAESALREAGCAVDRVRWDDPTVDWAGYDLAVVRSCWVPFPASGNAPRTTACPAPGAPPRESAGK